MVDHLICHDDHYQSLKIVVNDNQHRLIVPGWSTHKWWSLAEWLATLAAAKDTWSAAGIPAIVFASLFFVIHPSNPENGSNCINFVFLINQSILDLIIHFASTSERYGQPMHLFIYIYMYIDSKNNIQTQELLSQGLFKHSLNDQPT